MLTKQATKYGKALWTLATTESVNDVIKTAEKGAANKDAAVKAAKEAAAAAKKKEDQGEIFYNYQFVGYINCIL